MTINAAMNSFSYGNDELMPPFSGDCVPIVLITTQEDGDEDESQDEWSEILPLPASKYRYTKWHEIENITVGSTMLRAPRIRKAPLCYKKDTIYAIEEHENSDSDIDIESGGKALKSGKKKKRKKRQDFRNKLENWQTCNCVNLSYQDLGHGFQSKDFFKVLRKLVRCIEIQLIENSFTDLHTLCFPSCARLYLQRNLLASFKKLPRLPNVEHLSLQQNSIQSLEGLEIFRNSRLKSLILDGNPVSLEKDYRKRVFQILPMLKLLDELPKLPCDVYLSNKDDSKAGKCAIS